MAPAPASSDPWRRLLNWLARRDRSEREIRIRLKVWGVDEAEGEALIDRLKRQGLVDDRALAERICDWHCRQDPLGPGRLWAKMRARGIDSSHSRDSISAASTVEIQRELALRLFRKRLPALQKLPTDRRLQRISSYLERRGFDRGVIIELCRSLLTEVESREDWD